MNEDFVIQDPPVYRYELIINGRMGLRIHQLTRPNIFWRIMQWIILGFEWRKL
jgi:hypothetical protein